MKLLLILFVSITFSCKNSHSEYILNEEFNTNQIGWTEEKTDYHNTEINNGELLILSLDTAARISSNGPRNNTFLWSLPSKWKFETSIKIIDGGVDAGFGFIIYSSSLNYKFSMQRNGNVTVSEYDYNTEKTNQLIEKSADGYKLDYNTPVSLLLEVNDSNLFEFFIDGVSVGNGKFRAKSWETLRLFAESNSTGIKADFYRFQAL